MKCVPSTGNKRLLTYLLTYTSLKKIVTDARYLPHALNAPGLAG